MCYFADYPNTDESSLDQSARAQLIYDFAFGFTYFISGSSLNELIIKP